jgi:hypothetical protein
LDKETVLINDEFPIFDEWRKQHLYEISLNELTLSQIIEEYEDDYYDYIDDRGNNAV